MINTLAPAQTGYGNVKVEGRNRTAHSVSYEINVGTRQVDVGTSNGREPQDGKPHRHRIVAAGLGKEPELVEAKDVRKHELSAAAASAPAPASEAPGGPAAAPSAGGGDVALGVAAPVEDLPSDDDAPYDAGAESWPTAQVPA